MSQENRQTILIIGAGAMGRLWAAYLSPAFHVMFGRRQPGAAELACQFSPFNPASRQIVTVRIPVAKNTEIQPDLVLVTTKAPDALEALRRFSSCIGDNTPILLFQNGMGSQQAIAETWPHMPVIAASTTEGAYLDDQGKVIHAGKGSTWLGGLTPSGQSKAALGADLLTHSGLDIQIDANIERRLWMKLAINAGINPFTAILDCPNGGIIGQPFFETRIGDVCTEVSRVMTLHNYPCTAEMLEDEVRTVAQRTAANSSSMRQDVKAGRSTEIEMMNGFIVSESERQGLDAPVNRFLANKVKAL
ncbi:ketopantoate reductase family protein [Marinobacter sp. V034]|uniref:ketopantoate reductase family protein n=1 Tax=Marinobacter sp. V034 TaxID=3459610 RepID=UPI004043C8EE